MSQLAKLVAVLYVFAASVAILCWSAGDPGLAAPYADPVTRIQAYQEAVYASAAFETAAHGGWLTPLVLGRPMLADPPLEIWFQAAWQRLLGAPVWAARMPGLLAGAATASLVFAWLLFEFDDLATALIGAVLILSSHLFFAFSRIGTPDALLTFWITLAMFALSRSPRLDSASALWTFAVAIGSALMTSGWIGALPLLALVLMVDRPPRPRLLLILAISAALAAPWHLYQLASHAGPLRAQYGSPWPINPFGSTSAAEESSLWFYPHRALLLDPPLLAGALIALLWKRSRLILAWCAAAFVSLLFEPRHAANLLPLLPAMAIVAAGAVPTARARWALGLAVVLFIAKLLQPAAAWGIPWDPEVVDPVDSSLARYTALHRGNELIVVQPDDHLYAIALLLPEIRYAYAHASAPNPDAAATLLAPTDDALGALIRQHPDSDFFVPSNWMLRDQGVHQVLPMRGARAFLLARKMIHRP